MKRQEQILAASMSHADKAWKGEHEHAAFKTITMADFSAGATWADSHPQWIPVEERLPEHCDCLLYTEPRNIHGPFEGRFRFGFYNYADQRWEIQGEKWDNTIVTHWMPIVPPRKEE